MTSTAAAAASAESPAAAAAAAAAATKAKEETPVTHVYFEPSSASDLILVKQKVETEDASTTKRRVFFHVHALILAASSKWAEAIREAQKDADRSEAQNVNWQSLTKSQAKKQYKALLKSNSNGRFKSNSKSTVTSSHRSTESNGDDLVAASDSLAAVKSLDSSEREENDRLILVPDTVTETQLRAYLEFVHHRSELTLETCRQIIPSAFYFDAKQVISNCESHLMLRVELDATTRTLPYLELLLLCDQYHLDRLMPLIKPHVKTNIATLFNAPQFATIWSHLSSELSRELLGAMRDPYNDVKAQLQAFQSAMQTAHDRINSRGQMPNVQQYYNISGELGKFNQIMAQIQK